jgi:hypothetical protein
MGGTGSGRWRRARYALVERCPSLDVRSVVRGVEADAGGRWLAAGVASAIAAGLRPPILLRIRLGRSQHDPPDTAIETAVGLTCTPCHFGGYRWWWLCTCGRRCRRLHSPAGNPGFACRACHKLRYETQRLAPNHRWRRRALSIYARIGAGDDGDLPPDRPPGIHRRRYARLCEQADDFDAAAIGWEFSRLLQRAHAG